MIPCREGSRAGGGGNNRLGFDFPFLLVLFSRLLASSLAKNIHDEEKRKKPLFGERGRGREREREEMKGRLVAFG